MSEREKTIAEIREALEKATPGPWKIDEFGAVIDRKGSLIQWYDGKVVTAQKEDAHLIANAPEWLRFLLTELSDAQEQNRKLIEERDFWKDEYAVTVAKENEKLREQLQSAQAEVEKWKQKHEECAKISMMLADRNVEQGDEIEQLRRELAEKDEVLRWYADTMNYEYKTSYLDQDAPILDDCGQRARDVLVKWAQR